MREAKLTYAFAAAASAAAPKGSSAAQVPVKDKK
jgi:hypothetical protein